MVVPDPDRLQAVFAEAGLRPAICIGTCGADPSERTLDGEPVPALGWQHRWG